jgi:signal transduction histidine kinase
VRSIVTGWSDEHGLLVHLQLNGPNVQVPILLHSEFIRMLSELLTNVARHADANQVWVRVTLSSAGATLAVRDDGRGFVADSQDPWADDGHFGLLGTRERVSMLGGRFRLVTSPGSGTEVTIDLPLTPREERAVTALRQSE